MRLSVLISHLRSLFVFAVLMAPMGSRAQPAPPPAAPTAPKTLFLIRGPDGLVTAIRAISVEQQGAVLLIINANGGRAMVQARTVVGQLPWYSDEELAGDAVDPAQLAAKYEVLAGRLPQSQRKFLDREAARFRALQKHREDEAIARKNTAEARIQSVTATVYDPASAYSIERLESLLQAAEAVRTEDPSAGERLDHWEAPFRDHLAQLKAGARYENGAWITKEAMALRAHAAQVAVFLKSLDAPTISAVALPASAVHEIATKVAVGTIAAILLGAGLIIGFRRRPLLRLAGIALLVSGPGTAAGLFFLATRNPDQLPAVAAPADLRPLVALLSEAAGLEGSAPSNATAVSENVVNTFLSRHVRLEHGPTGDPWAAARKALAVRLKPDRASIFELLRSVGRSWIVRYDLVFPRADGHSSFVVAGVKIGALDCPPALAQKLWSSLEPQLAGILVTLHLPGRFNVQGGSDGAIRLTPVSTPSPTPAPATPGEMPAAPTAAPESPAVAPEASASTEAATPAQVPEDFSPEVPSPTPAIPTPEALPKSPEPPPATPANAPGQADPATPPATAEAPSAVPTTPSIDTVPVGDSLPIQFPPLERNESPTPSPVP